MSDRLRNMSNLAQNKAEVSIIIPTYNESENIIQVLKSIGEHIPKDIATEAIVVDDNSPDGTGKVVEDYINDTQNKTGFTVGVIHRKTKSGLSSAILDGIQHSSGETVVVMDSDFSHPPKIIPQLVEEIRTSKYDIAIASRYTKGGEVSGWSTKRKLISKGATGIAKAGLGVNESDPMSGFFAFQRKILEGIKFDAIGYKMLLEILVKTKGAKVKEIPFTFTDRTRGSSKLDSTIMFDFVTSVWKLYRYGHTAKVSDTRTSVRFISKAGRFYTVGASGLLVNYLVSLLFVDAIINFWYIHATIIGIVISMSSNFILNKIWTFEDRNFEARKTLAQYGKFVGFSSLGALIQLGMVYVLVDNYQVVYPVALMLAVIIAASSNFILNKKWTFKEKVWS
uniref:Dolichol-phosphate mannosyltransferase n=2 Tax=environmental samples TaxID=651140 RepID=A0A075GQQ5_9ARCH|nr:glycosyl transferase family protein (DPM1) [uncultured marine thaumarchaeote KM3_169_G08]AIF05395.1 glycosyl transferase family protein (DPM1) [uncultured marine thaumarchaeote KM3_182_G05]